MNVLAMAEAKHKSRHIDFAEEEMKELSLMFEYLCSENYHGHVRLDIVKRRNKEDSDDNNSMI